MNELFKNQTVIISGGLGDIGKAISLAFADLGASVAIGDVRPAKESKKFLLELTRRKVGFHYEQVDVADAKGVRNWVANVEKELGTPTLIIPNAATVALATTCEVTPNFFPRMPFFNRTGIVFWSCMVVCGVVSMVTKPKPESELQGLIWNKESLSLPPEQRAQQRGLRSPFLWWAIITAVVLFFYIRYH